MKTALTIILFSISMQVAFAQTDPISKDKVAIGGYDVVAYFLSSKAIKGSPEISTVNKGITYYFSTAENKEAFAKNPAAYLPQYDGYCALAVGAQNKKVSINPEAFKITDGKLYLFFNGPLPLSGKPFNSIEPWNKDEANLIRKADTNWPALKAKKK